MFIPLSCLSLILCRDELTIDLKDGESFLCAIFDETLLAVLAPCGIILIVGLVFALAAEWAAIFSLNFRGTCKTLCLQVV